MNESISVEESQQHQDYHWPRLPQFVFAASRPSFQPWRNQSVVESGSEIIYKANVNAHELEDLGYICTKKKDVYILPFTRMTYYKLLNTLDLSMPINEQIDAYCMKVNSKMSPISFEEILTNAIHMPPYPYKPQMDKKNPGR